MISTMERRQGDHARIPCAIPVELTQTEHASGFEADAIDLSAGGLSLRAPRLPDIGTQLQCSFEAVPGGTRISGQGEVVWARYSGERSGEFGLRFTRIEPEAQALIDEMIAERVARGNSAPPEPAPRMARLELDRGDGPITAKVARAAGQDVVFEQPLDLLALGRSVVAHADKDFGEGNIVRVGLRMDGGTPTLALTVRFSQSPGDLGEPSEFGEFEWGDAPQADTEVAALPAPLDVAERGSDAPERDPGFPPERTTSIPKAIARSAARTTYERTLHGLPRAAATPSSSGEHAAAGADGTDATPGTDAAPRDRDAAWADAEWVDAPEAEPEMDTQPDMVTPVTGSGASAAPQPTAANEAADAEPLPRVLETPKASQLALFDANAKLAGTEQRRVNAGRTPELLATTTTGELAAPRVHSSYATPEGLESLDAGSITPAHEAISVREHLTPLDSPADFEPGGLGFDSDEVTEAARKSALVRFLRILVAIRDQAQALAEQAVDSARALTRKFASDPERRVVRRKPMSITLRGLGFRPRRTTGLPAGARDLQGNRARQRLLLSLAALAASTSIAIYWLAPAEDDDDLALHSELQLEAEGLRGESVASAATDPLELAASEQAQLAAGGAATPSAATEPAAVRGSAKTSRLPTVPSKVGLRVVESRPSQVSQVPPVPPSTLAAVRSDENAEPTRTFGSKQVPNARRFTLRMSAPIKALRGSRDAQGFDVVVVGSRSLDRAAPIRANHKAVSHASIVNRGERAELKIRFVAGKQPAYRVSAQGETLEILLGQ